MSTIGERTATALQFKKKNHEVYSPTPTGYERHGDKLEENHREMEVIRLIKQLRENGLSYQKIAEELNQQRIPTKREGNKWYASTVSYIMKNELYREVS